MDTRTIKAKNNEAGTFGATISAAEVGSATVTPVPGYAPGVIVARPGTEFEEHIYYQSKDAGAGTISGLVRDYTNLNGGTGREHINGAAWETLQSTTYINNIVDALQEGYLQEMQDVLYVSATTFTVETDRTSVYNAGRLVRFNQDNTKIGTVASSSYSSGTGLTTVITAGVTVPDPITHAEYGIQPKNASYLSGNSPAITTPKITTSINDANGNEVIKTPATASAVNEVTITNAATGGTPKVSATGDDTNIDLELAAKGSGMVKSNTLYGDITSDTDGATITIDAAVTNRRQVVLGGNRALAITNMKKGQIIVFEPIQDSTGTRLISTWPSWGAVATMTIATPGVVTAGKDIPTATPVIFTTTGALPTGVTASTVYWWTRIDATTGKLSTSLANCQAGTYIATSGSQSGVHTMAVQVRWAAQTAPVLTTGKYLGDIINFYVKDAVNTVVEGIVATQGI